MIDEDAQRAICVIRLEEEALRFNTTVADILGRSRFTRHAEARRAVMMRLAADGIHPSRIGVLMGRDRSTVMYNIRSRFRRDKMRDMRERYYEGERW